LNGFDVRPATDDAFELVVAVASGEIRDVTEIARGLAPWRTDLT
jgi:hypothetical protein